MAVWSGTIFLVIFFVISTVYTSQVINRNENELPNNDIKKVHVISMNHLDVGYASFVNNVLNEYFTKYFAQAIKLGKQLSDGGYVEKFTYTTHPWLVSLYLDCPPNLVLAGIKLKCPSADDVKNFTDAVNKGVIAWHAGPMNLQVENSDEMLTKMSIQLGYDLDKRFNITRKMAVLSQRDVPGMTQAAIPIFAKMGIKAVSVGVNSMTAPPAVPKVFRWQYNGSEVLATWHPGGYPNNPGNPAHPGGLSLNDCATVPGFSEAMCYAFRTDNSGPPASLQEVLLDFEILRRQFPGAEIQGSTFDQFFIALAKSGIKLPVVTTEIGDTWIQGIASDPRKLSDMRAVSRVFGKCVKDGRCSWNDERVRNGSRFLMKMPEHTWGLPTDGDAIHWTNEDFAKTRYRENFRNCEKSWIEQRAFVPLTIEALRDHPVTKDIIKELKAAMPQQPNLDGFSWVPPATEFKCSPQTTFQFDRNGALLNFNLEGITIASKKKPFGTFMYQTFDQADFDAFARLYAYANADPGYHKPNMTKNARVEHRVWPTLMDAVYLNDANPCDVYVHVKLIDRKPTEYYGGPRDIWIRYTSSSQGSSGSPEVNIDFQYFGKVVTRLPEALYFALQPPTTSTSKWMISKLEQPVDPLNVVLNGSQYLHAVDGISLTDRTTGKGFMVNTMDAPLISLMTPDFREPHVLPAPLSPLKNITGMAFNLYNNVWGTNYIFWYPYRDQDADFRARFTVIPISGKKTNQNQNYMYNDF